MDNFTLGFILFLIGIYGTMIINFGGPGEE